MAPAVSEVPIMAANPNSINPKASLIDLLQYAYPIILLAFFVICFIARDMLMVSSHAAGKPVEPEKTVCMGPGGRPLPYKHTRNMPLQHIQHFSRPRKLLFDWLSLAIVLSFLAHSVVVILHVLADSAEGYWCGQAVVVYLVGSFMVHTLLLISVMDSETAPTQVHAYTWLLSAIMEFMLVCSLVTDFVTDLQDDGYAGDASSHYQWDLAEVIIGLIRFLLLVTLAGMYGLFTALLTKHHSQKEVGHHDGDAVETASLLQHAEDGMAHGPSGHDYGSNSGASTPKPRKAPAGWEKPKTMPTRSWWEYIKSYSTFFPYLWPSKDGKLQVVFVLAFILTIVQRFVQVLVPQQAGVITDMLSDKGSGIPWSAIGMFIFLKCLQGQNGVLGAVRAMIWLPISQYSFRSLSQASFEHVHSLSLEFHLGKKTGEVISALGKGNAINNFLENVTFQVLPMIVDLCVAVAYFLVEFDVYYALVVGIVTFWYIYLTIRMARWRTEVRRTMVNCDREVDAVKAETMMAYETVKYFNAEEYEFDRYRGAVEKYQKAEYSVNASLNVLNVTQNLVFMAGLMIACFIAAYQVTTGTLRVGRFVTLLTYMAQLQSPLNFFGTFYRMIQNAMINSERMLELFKEGPTVVDRPGAEALSSCKGDVRFKGVSFAYGDRKPALEGLDFHCAPGTTTALVGESGGGKSTIFRLLFRFYQAESGSIEIDGHDVDDIRIDSLRKHIGVVPQDTVLFNETLMYNLKYANWGASEAEIFEACRAASIHDKILSFPEGYDTVVGERGLRLSGGEKQRIAIARTILKNPRIMMLDESTAALDSETEEHIQEALLSLAKGRTMLVIAHRLSTITMADQILVLHQGRVSERGSHDELLAAKGRYATMWKKQVRAQRAAEEARVLKNKADRLRMESAETDARNAAPHGERFSGSSEEEPESKKRA